jgi:hypothetical protein
MLPPPPAGSKCVGLLSFRAFIQTVTRTRVTGLMGLRDRPTKEAEHWRASWRWRDNSYPKRCNTAYSETVPALLNKLNDPLIQLVWQIWHLTSSRGRIWTVYCGTTLYKQVRNIYQRNSNTRKIAICLQDTQYCPTDTVLRYRDFTQNDEDKYYLLVSQTVIDK